MIFDRLAIGTANWGKEYNGAKVPEDDQKRILDYCQCSGIDMIDTASVYKNNVFEMASSYFEIVDKGDDTCQRRDRDVYGYLSHGMIWPVFHSRILGVPRLGLSIYEPKDIPKFGTFGVPVADIIQVPYSLYDRRFEPHFPSLFASGVQIHVRSVFLRGKIIKAGVEPWKCIAFCLMNPYVDRVIIGADSFEQFKENLRPFHRMDVMQKDDINLLDPRKWRKEEIMKCVVCLKESKRFVIRNLRHMEYEGGNLNVILKGDVCNVCSDKIMDLMCENKELMAENIVGKEEK